MRKLTKNTQFETSITSQEGNQNMTTLAKLAVTSTCRLHHFVLTGLLAVLLCAATSSTAMAVAINWDGGGGDDNWSTFTNFNPDGNPAGDDVTFDDVDAAGSAGVVTNIVDGSVSVGSLTYTKSVLAATTTFHTTQIDFGQTLTIDGGDFKQGVGNPPCSSPGACTGYNTHVTLTGAGTLSFINNGNFEVGQNSGTWNFGNRQDTLDMAGLSAFNMDATAWDIGRVAAGSPNTTMTLADVNNITADTLRIGHWNDNGILELGRDNTLNIDTMNVGFTGVNGGNGTIRFDTGLASPSVTIRDSSGSGAAVLNIAKPTQSGSTGTVDLTGGDVDALFSTITMAVHAPAGSGFQNGTLTFNDGTITATTINMSETFGGGTAEARSTVNINGAAELLATTINMVDSNAGSNSDGTARINLGGGTLRATTIQPGDDLGTGSKTREINFSSGTLRNAAGSDMSVAAEIDVNILTAAAHTFQVDAGQTTTIEGVIGGSLGTIEKTGDGTLLLNGTSTYSGTTNVNAGTLGGTGSMSGTIDVNSGGALGPGASAGTFSVVGDVTFNTGSVFDVELAGINPGEFDVLDITGGLTFDGGTVSPSFIDGYFVEGGSWIIASTTTGVTVNGSLDEVLSGYFTLSIINGGNDLLLTFQVPEPSSLSLLLLGGAFVRMRRRRKHKSATR